MRTMTKLTETKDNAGRRAASASGAPGFGVYVHWPFCLAKCPYCDFNSHVRESVDHSRWRRALLAELEHYGMETAGRTVTSVFFGGGTPSLMAAETVAAAIDCVRGLWRLAPDAEITLEANPGAAEAARFEAFADAGVNRLSIGVQALDDAALDFLGRVHSRREAVAAVEAARNAVPRWSFDLIYARPGQTVADWCAELDAALPLAGDHLSLYQLTIEPGTAFHTRRRLGDLVPPDEDRQAALYEPTQDRLAAAGLPAYEISNHACPGAESLHNLTYWRCGDYVGVGPGAHGRITDAAGERAATEQERMPEAWLAAVERNGHATRRRERVSRKERATEMLMMGLRLAEGVALDRFADEAGRPLEEAVDPCALARLEENGFLACDEFRLRATGAGRLCLDAVLGALLGR